MGIDVFTIAMIFTILGIGVFISFRILNITDLTVEASYGFGAVICALVCENGNPFVALICAFLGGCAAGLISALLHTKLKINAILSGILTLTGFYSINLIVADSRSTIPLKGYNKLGKLYNHTLFPSNEYLKFVIMAVIVIVLIVAVILFFKTRLGMSIRACGDNEQMTKAQCISTDLMKIIGLMISNGLVALAGAFFVQFQGSYSTKMETGMMVVGVATIIIGELLTFKKHQIWLILIGILAGSVIYRMIYNLVLQIEFIQSRDIQLIQSIFLILIIAGGILADKTTGKIKLKRAKVEEIDKPESDGDDNA